MTVATLHAETIVIDKAACRMVTKHVPSADVEYQPGVDAMGRKVVPADLPGRTNINLPDTITIDVTPKIEKWLTNTNQFPNDRLKDSEINLGKIEIVGDSVTYNGQPLNDTQQDNLAVLCLNR